MREHRASELPEPGPGPAARGERGGAQSAPSGAATRVRGVAVTEPANQAAVSGLYSWRGPVAALAAGIAPVGPAGTGPDAAASPAPATPPVAAGPTDATAELRLDVDGRYPQMLASGVFRRSLTSRIDWLATLAAAGAGRFAGPIVFREPANPPLFPYTEVRIRLSPPAGAARRSALVSFIGPAGVRLSLSFAFKSPSFHSVDLEFDSVTGEAPTLGIDTGAHPNRPATLACESLSVQSVYVRAGFAVTTSPPGSVPLSCAGADAAWSNQELHDAMQVFWSRFSSDARWALWTLFATVSDRGAHLGGVMFDQIGPQQRQGCAVFNDSFVARPPAGDPDPAAWVERMRFWAACHEAGHCFNLAHSWLKSGGTPWVPLADEPEGRSFMNYPARVEGGERAFFGDFAYRFSDAELTFIRHAPARFVQMGGAPWFDDHGFEDAAGPPDRRLRLELRANRERPLFEFMEPPRLELKLANVSYEPVAVDRRALEPGDGIVAVVKRHGRPAYSWRPYYIGCWGPDVIALAPGDALYGALPLASGARGWTIDEPGRYTVQVGLRAAEEQLVSGPLELWVAPPRGRAEELLAQDYFDADVGRAIGLQGSRALPRANDTLRELVDRVGDGRAAMHARFALGNSIGPDQKALVADAASPTGFGVVARRGDRDQGGELMRSALLEQPDRALETFGHIGYRARLERFGDWLAENGALEEARRSQRTLHEVLARRTVRGRGVRAAVLEEVRKHRHA